MSVDNRFIPPTAEGEFIPANIQLIKSSDKLPKEYDTILLGYKVIFPDNFVVWAVRVGWAQRNKNSGVYAWFVIGGEFDTIPNYWALINDPVER